MKNKVVPAALAWEPARANAWRQTQAALMTEPGETRSNGEVTFITRLVDGLGADTESTLLIRRWLHGKRFLPDGFELDGKQYGHAAPFTATLEEQLTNLLFCLLEFKPIEGWEALTYDERVSHVKLLQDTARAFADALAAPCTPPLPSLLEYIPDEDGERLLRGGFRYVNRDIEHDMGATEIQRANTASRYPVERATLAAEGWSPEELALVSDEDIYVGYVEDFVGTMNSFLTQKKPATNLRATMARELFDSALFSIDEGEPFDFGVKFAAYLRAFADTLNARVDTKVRAARPRTNATAKHIAIWLKENLEGTYGVGEYSVGVIAALSSVWFAARQAGGPTITGRQVTEFLRPAR